MSAIRRLTVVSVALGAMLALPAGAVAVKPVGALTQLTGLDGCFSLDGSSEDGGATCRDGLAVDGPFAMVVSPDGLSLYTSLYTGNGIGVFGRGISTGALTQPSSTDGCITVDGASSDGGPGTCTDGRAVNMQNDGRNIVVSPDGKFVYVGASDSNAIASFSRDPGTGKLTQLPGTDGCVSSDGSSEDGAATCQDGRFLDDIDGLALSADGATLYGVNGDAGFVVFSRDGATGKLTQLAGSNDGSSEDGAATCTDGLGVDGPYGIDITPDGRNVYVALYDGYGLAAFSRDAATGKLTQLAGTFGCISMDGSSSDGAGTCQDGRAATQPYDLTASPDGLNLYLGAYAATGAVTAYRRDPATGNVTQIPDLDGCYSPDGASDDDGAGTCTDIRGGDASGPLGLSPDGAFLYAPGYADNTIVALSRQIPPACSNSAAATNSNRAVSVPLTCRDLNGDPITRAVASQPASGTLGAIDQAAGTAVYTPKKNFNGTDTFTFAASDGGQLPSNVAIATITVRDTVAANCKPRSKKVSLDKLDHGKVTFRLRCSEPARVTADLLAARKASKGFGLVAVKRVKIGGGKKRATRAGVIKLRVKVKRRARKALKQLSLRKAKRLKLALRVKTRDNANNRRRKTTKLKLKR
jgi:DNA-binding beta-propeller fold protein YncE